MSQANSEYVKLVCTHTMLYRPPPRNGDIVWCAECGTYRKVISELVGFSGTQPIKVQCRKCTFLRNPNSLEKGVSQANGHSIKRNHIVDVVQVSGTISATIYPPPSTVTNL